MTRKIIIIGSGALVALSLITVVPAFAAGRAMGQFHKSSSPIVVGTVTSIHGETIVIASLPHPFGFGLHASSTPPTTATTTYSIDATNAKIVSGTTKNESLSISNVAVGDNVIVEGTVSNTNVTATNIIDGLPTPSLKGVTGGKHLGKSGYINHQPIVHFNGTIQGISENTLTVTGSSTTYTVDTSKARINYKNGGTASLSTLKNGDTVSVLGFSSTTTPENIQARMIRDLTQLKP